MAAKIVLAGINIACLIISLLYPNSATPFALLPVIITSVSWVFYETEKKYRLRYLLCATLLGAICSIVGSTSDIFPVDSKNINFSHYIVRVKSEVAFLSGSSIDYWFFAFFVFIGITLLIISQVISQRSTINDNNLKIQGQSIEAIFRDNLFHDDSLKWRKK